jgi:ribonuclease BN (tRNA processing enzyme)
MIDKKLLEVRVIGAGSAGAKKYFNTSLLVTFPDGYRLLVDCGFNIPKALHEQNISIDSIDGLFVTHTHADHVGGIEELAFMNRYAFAGRKMDLLIPGILEHELWENSLKGGLECTEEGLCELEDYFNIKKLWALSSNNPLGLQIFPTDHVKHKDSFAVGFDDKLLYSGDTKFSAALINIGRNYKTIIHDCQLPSANGKVAKKAVHTHLHELMALDEDIQNKIYMIHYGDNAETFVGKTGKLRFATEGTTYLI